MEREISIEIGALVLDASLNDKSVSRAIYEALPLAVSGQYWGAEIYFPVPVAAENESPQEEVEVGQLAYWPPGNALCIFFGPTPASTSSAPRAASPVTVVGRLEIIPAELLRRPSLETIDVRPKRSAS